MDLSESSNTFNPNSTAPNVERASPRGATRQTSLPFGRVREPIDRRARGRRGESLASARDRERLRERNAAERARVEKMFARAPIDLGRRARRRPRRSESASPVRLRSLASTDCPVCGDGRVASDEVRHQGPLQLLECLHCEHRWTERPRARRAESGPSVVRPERPRATRGVAVDPELAALPF
jgi:hypothetical protein